MYRDKGGVVYVCRLAEVEDVGISSAGAEEARMIVLLMMITWGTDGRYRGIPRRGGGLVGGVCGQGYHEGNVVGPTDENN